MLNKFNKILHCYQKNFCLIFITDMKIQQTSLNFQAGMTKAIRQEINSTDINKISNMLYRENGIVSDFKQNKAVAWSSAKCVELIKSLNKNYNLQLGLPKGIFVEDFNALHINDKTATGTTNFLPSLLLENSNEIVPENTIFFNEFKELNYKGGNEYWDKIDKWSDINFDEHFSATDFFMEIFIHEFTHVIHSNNLLKNMSMQKLAEKFNQTQNPIYLRKFHDKYENWLNNICIYASSHPFEAVACDLSKRIIDNTDKNTFGISKNIISQSPYERTNFITRKLKYKDMIDKLLNSIWRGKIDI